MVLFGLHQTVKRSGRKFKKLPGLWREVFYYILALPLNPDNQQSLLWINSYLLAGGKAESFQPAAFNGQLRSGVGLPAIRAVTER